MIDVADSNAVYYYHFDGLGPVVALSDSDGDTVQTYEYSIYGQVAAEDPNHTNPYMFTGRRFDFETGLYYYRARYYNPYIGRFLQTDPVGYGYGNGINWYAYCGNNPVGRVDPSGLDAYLIFYADSDRNDKGLFEIWHVGIAVDTPGGVIYRDADWDRVRGLREGDTVQDVRDRTMSEPFTIAFKNVDGSDKKIADYLRSGRRPFFSLPLCTTYATVALAKGGYTYGFFGSNIEFNGLSSWPLNLASQLVKIAESDPDVYVKNWAEWGKYSNPTIFRYTPWDSKKKEKKGDPLAWPVPPIADPKDVYVGYGIDDTGGTYWVDSGGIEYKGHIVYAH